MSSKNCPHCRYERLQVTHYHDEELDVCRQCAGVWFEHGELNSIISKVDNGEDDSDFEGLLGKDLGPTALSCPGCDAKLHRFQLLNDYDVEVDLCHQCDGVWVDYDELEKVEHSPRIHQALSNLNQKLSIKTWLFQLLIKFPVEYNLKPHRVPVVTWVLVVLNCLIYAIYGFQPGLAAGIFENFASRPADLAQGQELWTLLTATFLHGDFMHLFGNMYFLVVIGDNLEDVLGRWRFLLLYLLSGISASIISVAMNWGSPIPSVGASGAIAALFGMYIVWFRFASLTFMFVVFQKKLSAVWYFAIWLALDNIFVMLIGGRGVDYWAHIGGFVVGLGLGVFLKTFVYRNNPVVRFLAEESVKVRR
ncbi:rhomboid family intramembrane serine protease [Litoribrevibacter euphylliae]|uniref:Rhomboid family intramembrane serine protease n=1 Tax=Litoribrevibacter euphylliae TaxID=1834034 RepID=A0ABV7HCW1_9GAMM